MGKSVVTDSPRFHGERFPGDGRGWLARLVQAQALWRSRQRLGTLDDAALRDLGLSREEALAEAAKPVWEVPGHWLR